MAKVNVKLKEILEEKNITMYALAKKTGISEHNIANLTKGNTVSVRFDTLLKICEELDIEISDILEIEKD